jgi:hypothetical protein
MGHEPEKPPGAFAENPGLAVDGSAAGAVGPAAGPAPRSPRDERVLRWVGFLVLLVVVGGVGYGIGRVIGSGGSSHPTASTSPSARVPTDPSAKALGSIVVSQADVASSLSVELLPHGNQVSGQPTLDLCNGTFASEKLRRARLQVVAVDPQGTAVLSTEAVLYANPAAADQAMAELKSTAASCPARPVTSPVGEPTVTTKFNGPPDRAWSSVPDVDREAFDFVTTDASGRSEHSVTVYLRRGRALLGLYFPAPDAPLPAVAGRTTLEADAALFATRLARLPASVVDG